MTREELLCNAKPILFNTEMVRAILDGRKTVTRRCVKFINGKNPNWTGYLKDGLMLYNGTNEPCIKACQYQPGDTLYVRETWSDHYVPDEYGKPNLEYCYKADGIDIKGECLPGESNRWYPSIHMPKKAARIFLKVKYVRVERLQEINDEQAKADGMPDTLDYPVNKTYCPVCNGIGFLCSYDSGTLCFVEDDCPNCNTYVKRFKNFWNTTIKKSDIYQYGWDANPYVWVIEFKRIIPG